MSPNRNTAPVATKPDQLPALDLTPMHHFGAMPIYGIEGGDEDLIRIEFVFRAGTRYEQKNLVASACNALLKEGTAGFTSIEISETLDFYGASLVHEVSKDRASVYVVCLSKYLEAILPIFTEIVTQPVFDENELAIFKRRSRSRLEVNLQKVEFQCRLLFSAALFKDTPYIDYFIPGDFDLFHREDILDFFKENYRLENAFCIVSGKNAASAADMLVSALGKAVNFPPASQIAGPEVSWVYEKSENLSNKEGYIQSAIRMGLPMPGHKHADYPALYVLNTALGGYFGSRLMQNIREDKGYTYGISSGINIMEKAAYLAIGTQVGSSHTDATIFEIRKEISRLRDETMDIEELRQIQFYLAGNLLQRMDGTFELVGRLKTLLTMGLDSDHYPKFINRIFALEPEELKEIANKYLLADRFSLAVIGTW